MNGQATTSDMVGTPQYSTPEMHERKPYVPASLDLFTAGYILFALMTGVPPFSFAIKKDGSYKHIIDGNFN
jgi:serine/threonine protein kinase